MATVSSVPEVAIVERLNCINYKKQTTTIFLINKQ